LRAFHSSDLASLPNQCWRNVVGIGSGTSEFLATGEKRKQEKRFYDSIETLKAMLSDAWRGT